MPMNFSVSDACNLANLSQGKEEKKEYAHDKKLFLPALDYRRTRFQEKLRIS